MGLDEFAGQEETGRGGKVEVEMEIEDRRDHDREMYVGLLQAN